ncbi:hypothetical protein STEG23_018507, partial [Scotinomys teguina]
SQRIHFKALPSDTLERPTRIKKSLTLSKVIITDKLRSQCRTQERQNTISLHAAKEGLVPEDGRNACKSIQTRKGTQLGNGQRLGRLKSPKGMLGPTNACSVDQEVIPLYVPQNQRAQKAHITLCPKVGVLQVINSFATDVDL